MGKNRRVFTKEFKEEAITLVKTSGRSYTDIANSLGIDVNMLCRWRRESEAESYGGKIVAFPGKGRARDEEMARLKKENADLKESNEILKKAMAIFTIKNPR